MKMFCSFLSLYKRIQKLGKSTQGSTIGTLRTFQLVWRTNPWLTIVMILVTALQALLPASTIYVNKLLLDLIVLAIKHSEPPDLLLGTIILLTIIQLLLNLLVSLLSTLSSACQQNLQDQTTQQMLFLLIQHVNTLDMAFFERSESYNKLQQVQSQANYRPMTIISNTFSLIRNLIVFLSMVTLLWHLQWILAIVALLAPIPAFISDSRYGWRGFQMMRTQSEDRRMGQYLVNLLTTDSYYKEVKIFDVGRLFIERFKVISQRFMRENRRLVTRRYLMGFVWSMFTTLASSGTFLYVAIQAIYGRVTIGDLTLYTQAASSVQSNFQGILSGFSSMYENNLYLNVFFEILAMKPQISRPEYARPLQRPFTQGIEFRNVTFIYEGQEKPALRNVSFKLNADETLAIVGRNGAGKTTLVKLLSRFYDPQEGQILVNGHDIREYDPVELRKEVGVIFQDYVRYQLSAQENIGIGRVDHIEDRGHVEVAAIKGGADEVVAKLPKGYETRLGRWFSDGHELSGGQWQKLALARGFMRDSQILILDEPTSALDAKTEYELFARMRELTCGRTAIFISHRFSTVRLADHILVIEDGRVIEQGTHQELLVLNGHYAELFNLQATAYR
jgi:ATP-binding cassette subfamily B protein